MVEESSSRVASDQAERIPPEAPRDGLKVWFCAMGGRKESALKCETVVNLVS